MVIHSRIHTLLPKNEFILTTKFILQSTFFHFNNKYYKQTFEAPMGSLLSPIVADLMLQKLESQIINKLSIKPNFYYRYVDDIAFSAPLSCLKDLLDSFNSFHPRIKFIMEVRDEELNFLDLIIIKRDGRLHSNWFRKPTFSGRFLNFHSQHPFTHKKGIILNLIDRVILLFHPEFHTENFDYVIKILLDNGYPLALIFSIIRRRLYSKINHKHLSRKEPENISPYFIIPYVSFIAKKFIKFFKNISFCKLAFSCYDKLNKFIKVHKDILPTHG